MIAKSSIIASLIQTTDTRKIPPVYKWLCDRAFHASSEEAVIVVSKFPYNEIMDISFLFNRCDVITDQYFEGSLKEETRGNHGSGRGLLVTFDNCSDISPNFICKFLSTVTNKTNLSKFLAKKLVTYHEDKQSILCVTFGDSIVRNSVTVLSETDINQCSVPMQTYVYLRWYVKWKRKFSRSLWYNC